MTHDGTDPRPRGTRHDPRHDRAQSALYALVSRCRGGGNSCKPHRSGSTRRRAMPLYTYYYTAPCTIRVSHVGAAAFITSVPTGRRAPGHNPAHKQINLSQWGQYRSLAEFLPAAVRSRSLLWRLADTPTRTSRIMCVYGASGLRGRVSAYKHVPCARRAAMVVVVTLIQERHNLDQVLPSPHICSIGKVAPVMGQDDVC